MLDVFSVEAYAADIEENLAAQTLRHLKNTGFWDVTPCGS
jgi:hypothetical protein